MRAIPSSTMSTSDFWVTLSLSSKGRIVHAGSYVSFISSIFLLQVLTQVEARVNFGTFDPFPRDTQSVLEILESNTGVRYRNSSGCFILSGTFIQIEAANKVLHHLVKGNGERNSAQTEADPSNRLDERGSDSSSISEYSSFDVQPKVMQLLKRVHKKKLQEIQETFSVEIDWIENTNQVNICPKKGLNNLIRLQEGCDAFINLYQEFYPNMAREEVELSDSVNERLVQQVVSVAEAEDPIIVEKEDKKLVVYAEKNSIRGYVQFLKEKLGIARDSNSKRTRRGQGSTGQSTSLNDKRSRQGGYLPTQHLVHVLDNEVKLSLYNGDITDEAVDAIVNAANERLQHGAGVAAAIVRKGGRQIQEESNRLIIRYGTLNVGGAVYTSGGTLSCRYVIHAVGPEWYRHGKDMSRSLLCQSCLESLALAVKLNLSSIALTAISSGIFGMPKDTCAEVMFLAIEEFSSSEGAKFSTLRDVRIVIIDEPTLSVFQEEFAKRYVAHEASPETVSTQGRPSDGQGSTSSAPDSKDSAHQSKRNYSSPSTRQAQFSDNAVSGEKREQNGDVGSPSVPANPDEVGQSSTTPDSVNESGKNGYKDNLSTGQLNKDEQDCNSGVKDPPSVVDPVKYNESNGRPSFSAKGRGRERGNLAPNFTGNETAKNATGGTNLGVNSSEISKGGARPPGLTVTQEGKTLAKSLNIHGAGDQKSNVDKTGKAKIAEDDDEPSGDDLQNAKQVQNLANQSFDSENSKIEAGDGDRTDHTPNTSSREGSNKHSNNKDVSNDKQLPQQLKEEDFSTPGMKTDQKSEQPTNPTLNDNNEAVSSQDEVIIRSTKPEETQSAMGSTPEHDPSAASNLSPSSEHSFSNQDVTNVDKDKVGERRDAGESENQDHAAGIQSDSVRFKSLCLQQTPVACPNRLSSFIVILCLSNCMLFATRDAIFSPISRDQQVSI